MRSRLVITVAVLTVFATGGSALAVGPWKELRRPIDLPRVQPGQTCPGSRVDPSVHWEDTGIFGGSGIGRGPIYAGLGSEPTGDLLVGPWGGTDWLGGKLFWYADPSYRDRALIRGRR